MEGKSEPKLVPDSHARQILHPTETGLRMTPVSVGEPDHAALFGVILNGLQAVKDLARVGRNLARSWPATNPRLVEASPAD